MVSAEWRRYNAQLHPMASPEKHGQTSSEPSTSSQHPASSLKTRDTSKVLAGTRMLKAK